MPAYLPFLRPPPPGTHIIPWFPRMFYTPYVRAGERVGVYFYNQVIAPTEIGLYSKFYNQRVHGPYVHTRWYGQPDTKFMDVKIIDVPAWFSRRDWSLMAIWSEFLRQFLTWHEWYFSGPIFGSVIQMIIRYLLYAQIIKWLFFDMQGNWDHAKTYYHW